MAPCQRQTGRQGGVAAPQLYIAAAVAAATSMVAALQDAGTVVGSDTDPEALSRLHQALLRVADLHRRRKEWA